MGSKVSDKDFKKLVNKLTELKGRSLLESLSSSTASLLDVEQDEIEDLMKSISFSDYLRLSKAVSAGDKLEAARIVKLSLLDEADVTSNANSYSSGTDKDDNQSNNQSNNQANDNSDISNLSVGDTITVGDSANQHDKVTSITNIGDTKIYNTDQGHKVTVGQTATSPDMMKQDIDRLKKMAGIEDSGDDSDKSHTDTNIDAVTKEGFSGGAISAGGISGVMISKNKIKKYTTKPKKPGPKPKSKHGTTQ